MPLPIPLCVRSLVVLVPVLLALFAGSVSAQVPPGLVGGAPAAESDAGPGEKDGSTPSAESLAGALIEALRDEEVRAAIIRELERIEQADPPGDRAAVQPAPETAEETMSVGRRVALLTQATAERTAEWINLLFTRAARAPGTFSSLEGIADRQLLFDALRDLFLALVTTYSVFLVLRYFARRLFVVMGRAASESGALRTVVLALASAAIDATAVVVAWAAGYAITLAFFGEAGGIGIRQTLYFNAFLVVEISRVLLRLVLSPSTGELRMIRISDQAATYLIRWLTLLIAILGYGHLLAVPIVNQNVSYLTGRAFSASITLIAVLLTVVLVVRSRRRVSRWLMGSGGQAVQSRGLRFIIRTWYVPVLIYLGWLLISVVVRPYGKLLPLLTDTAKVAVAIIAAMAVMGFISRAIERGISLPAGITARLPLLEHRLNAFLPHILFAIRFVVLFALIAYTLSVIGFVDVETWLSSKVGANLSATIVSVAAIVFAAFLVWLALSSWVDYRLNPNYGRVANAREETLLTLLRNAGTITLVVITLMFALSEMGIDIAPLLASAGVVGLAIGFGAQKLVQDIITGIFIQFENAINVGDVVTVGGTTGAVERLTIRSVSLRDVEGVYHIIPFSTVDMVSNYMRGFGYYLCDMGIAYREKIEDARVAMLDAYEELRSDPEHQFNLIGDLEWFGLQSFGDNAVVVRARIKTKPGKQWSVGRAFNGILKRIFDERGIEIPFPHQTIYFGEDKKGHAPPLHMAIERLATRTAPATDATADQDRATAD